MRIRMYNDWDYDVYTYSKAGIDEGIFEFVTARQEIVWHVLVVDEQGSALSNVVDVQFNQQPSPSSPVCPNRVDWRQN